MVRKTIRPTLKLLQENQMEFQKELNKKLTKAISLDGLTLNDMAEKLKDIRTTVKIMNTSNRTKGDKEISKNTQKLKGQRRIVTRD